MKQSTKGGSRMPPLVDPILLHRFRLALSNWEVSGYVEPVGLAAQWLRRAVPNVTQRGFLQVLHDHVFHQGGVIDQQPETRENWRDKWEYHYDLRPTLNGVRLYVESRLYPESLASQDEPMIYIVNIHDA